VVEKKVHNIKTILTFIIPSLIGLLLFMTPISYQGAITIPIAIVSKGLQAFLGDSLISIVTAIVVFMALASLATKLLQPKIITEHGFLNSFLNVSTMWLMVRILGAVFIVLTYLGIGPEAINSGNTGALVLNDLLPVLFCVFVFAGMFPLTALCCYVSVATFCLRVGSSMF